MLKDSQNELNQQIAWEKGIEDSKTGNIDLN
jgi:hypothetical protein